MTASTPSDEQKLLIAGYVLQDLSPEEAADFEQLINDHPHLIEELNAMQTVLESVYGPTEVAPPLHLRAAVLEKFQAMTPADSVRQTFPRAENFALAKPQSSHNRRGWWASLGAVAALLIVGLSLSNLILWQKLQIAQRQRESPNALTVSLQSEQSDFNQTAEVIVRLDPANLEATLQVANLPPLPEEQVYVLWTVLQPNAPFTTDEKNAILTEVFKVDGEDTLTQITLPPVYRQPEWIRAIAVTVEAAEAPQRHVSSPILIESL